MSCKLPQCFPVSLDTNNLKTFENFYAVDVSPPVGYLTGLSPNPDVQATYEASSSTLYITRENPDKTFFIPDPSAGKGIKDWSIIMINAGDQVRIQSTVRTHRRLADNEFPGCSQHCGWGHSVDAITTNNDLTALFNGNHGIDVYVQPPPPSDVSSLTFSNITTNSFTVNWQGGDYAMSYEFALNGNKATPDNPKDSYTKTATFSNLNPGTNYNVSIKPVNVRTSANPGTGSTTTVAPPPPPPAPPAIVPSPPVSSPSGTIPSGAGSPPVPGAPIPGGSSSDTSSMPPSSSSIPPSSSSMPPSSSFGTGDSSIPPPSAAAPPSLLTPMNIGIGVIVIVVIVVLAMSMGGGGDKKDE